jgi:hypothetical protein
VHGVGQQCEAWNMLLAWWAPALCDGVRLAGGRITESDVACAFHSDLFRQTSRHLHLGDPLINADDLGSFERICWLNSGMRPCELTRGSLPLMGTT